MQTLCPPGREQTSCLLSRGLCVWPPSTEDRVGGEGTCSVGKPARHDLCQVGKASANRDESR